MSLSLIPAIFLHGTSLYLMIISFEIFLTASPIISILRAKARCVFSSFKNTSSDMVLVSDSKKQFHQKYA